MDISCLKIMCGVTRMDRVTNEEVDRRTGAAGELTDQIDFSNPSR